VTTSKSQILLKHLLGVLAGNLAPAEFMPEFRSGHTQHVCGLTTRYAVTCVQATNSLDQQASIFLWLILRDQAG
jgi:hypothetical protein